MKRLIDYIRRWNVWRKWNQNSPLHKLLVLFNIIYSPTMECVDLIEHKKAEWAEQGHPNVKVTCMDHYPEREADNGTLDH